MDSNEVFEGIYETAIKLNDNLEDCVREVREEWGFNWTDFEQYISNDVSTYIEKMSKISVAAAASCLNYLEVVEKKDISWIIKNGKPVFDKIKEFDINNQQNTKDIKTECMLAMLYVYRYDDGIEEKLKTYINDEKGQIEYWFKQFRSWRNNKKYEKNEIVEIGRLILCEDIKARVKVVNLLKDKLDDEQLKKIQGLYLIGADSTEENNISKNFLETVSENEDFNEYVEYVRQNRPKSMQKLLFDENFYQNYLSEKKDIKEDVRLYVLENCSAERYLFFYYEYLCKKNINDNKSEQEITKEEVLEKWKKEIFDKYRDNLNASSKIWGEWFYKLNKMIFLLQEKIDEETFYEKISCGDLSVPSYDYENVDYIKKLAVLLSNVFCWVWKNGWNIEEFIDKIGEENNMFSYSKDKYFASSMDELDGERGNELYEEARKCFQNNFIEQLEKEKIQLNNGSELHKESYMNTNMSMTLHKMVKLYMNTNMRFVYDIHEFLSFIHAEIKKDKHFLNDFKFWEEYLKENPIDLMYSELKYKVDKVLGFCSYSKVKDKEVGSVFEEKFLEYLFSNYPIDAKIEAITPDKRAREKVRVSFSKLYTGGDEILSQNRKNRYTIYCDETWTHSMLEEIFTWGLNECKCKIHSFDPNQRKIYVTVIKQGEQYVKRVRKLDKQSEMKKLLDWLIKIKNDDNGIVFDPYFLYGKKGKKYEEVVLAYKGDMRRMREKIHFDRGYIFPCTPEGEEQKRAFAIAIFETLCVCSVNKNLELFFRQLNRGIMDAINEYKYTIGSANNAGTHEWSDNKNQRVLIYDKELEKRAEKDLNILCENVKITDIDKANIYMNSYLKQYIPLEKFWDKLNKRDMLFSDFFVSTENSNYQHNEFFYCLHYKGYDKENKWAEFKLYPDNNYQGYKWVFDNFDSKKNPLHQKIYYDNKAYLKKVNLKEKAEQMHIWASVSHIDEINQCIYIKELCTKEDLKKEVWIAYHEKLRDLAKLSEKYKIRKQVESICEIVNHIKGDKIDFYFHLNKDKENESRLFVITDFLCTAFSKCNDYNYLLMNEELKIFDMYNPYIEMSKEKTSKIASDTKNLLLNKYGNNKLKEAYESYVNNLSQIDKLDIKTEETSTDELNTENEMVLDAMKKILENYYKSFFRLLKNEDTFIEDACASYINSDRYKKISDEQKQKKKDILKKKFQEAAAEIKKENNL